MTKNTKAASLSKQTKWLTLLHVLCSTHDLRGCPVANEHQAQLY